MEPRQVDKPRCPRCRSRNVVYRKTDQITWCRVCGNEWHQERDPTETSTW